MKAYDINQPIYHGSPTKNITKLKIERGGIGAFGDGIYCTQRKDVAGCYSKKTGSIYLVKFSGEHSHTIDLDSPYYEQNDCVKKAILKTRKTLGLSTIIEPLKTTSDVLREKGVDTNEVNKQLTNHGIWLLYGYIDPFMHSGRMDDGVQLVILIESHIEIIGVL